MSESKRRRLAALGRVASTVPQASNGAELLRRQGTRSGPSRAEAFETLRNAVAMPFSAAESQQIANVVAAFEDVIEQAQRRSRPEVVVAAHTVITSRFCGLQLDPRAAAEEFHRLVLAHLGARLGRPG